MTQKYFIKRDRLNDLKLHDGEIAYNSLQNSFILLLEYLYHNIIHVPVVGISSLCSKEDLFCDLI